MEPMDLDEDSVGETPKRFTRSSSVPAFPLSSSYSSPQLSSLWTQLPQLTLPRALPCSTPVPQPTGQLSVNYNGPNTGSLRATSMTVVGNSPMIGFSSIRKPVSRMATPIQRAGDQYTLRSGQDCSPESANSSGRSDESEMEIGQCSPSPSWDRVVSAFQSISVFKSNSEVDQRLLTEKQAAGKMPTVRESHTNGISDAGYSYGQKSPWEPSLTVVQAATTFRQRKPEGKGSSSKTQLTALHSEKDFQHSTTPLKKLGEGTCEGTENRKNTSSKGPKFVQSDTVNGKTSLGCKCLKLLFVLILLSVIGVLIFSFQMHAAERCDRYAKMDSKLLRNEMASKLFGQHIAMDMVPEEVEKYLRSFRTGDGNCQEEHCHQAPPLLLTFHGWTGVGKNFVSDIIINMFPFRTVTKFLIPYHFPHPDQDELYRANVEEWVQSNVTEYSVNFFIFDEMDKATLGVVEGLKNAVTRLRDRGPHHSPAIFLLLSNSLGTEINRKLFQALLEGGDREHLTAADFSTIFLECDHEWYTNLDSSSLITESVPFLPLERAHVTQCIRRDLVTKKLSTDPLIVARVLNELTFTTLSSGHQFSQTGCKRVSDKVDYATFE